MKLVRILLAAPVLLVVVACGGAPDAAKSPSSVDRDYRSPATIEEAEQQIADANLQLSGTKRDAPEDGVKPSAEAPAPPPSASTEPTGSGLAKPKDEEKARVDVCVSPCRAFASMQRAVEALCRMTGETDDRCQKARRTLDASNGRVAACRCAR